MLIEVQAPREPAKSDWIEANVPTIFLAGGITNCADWQRIVINQLKISNRAFPNTTLWAVFNPRRDHYPLGAATEQIEWEHKWLQKVDAISFWFSPETLCPITLFEYGKWLGRNKKIFVGTDLAYARRFDVIEQTRLERPDITVHDSLVSLLTEIDEWFREKSK